MGKEKGPGPAAVLAVPRTKGEARRFYDRISRVYDLLAGTFERRFAEMALELLALREGEVVLEIGFGSGHCLKLEAQAVGGSGKVHGVDISSGMLKVTGRKLSKAGLGDRVQLCCGDAAKLPYASCAFDAVFMSHTLDLIDTPEIPVVLEEVKRVLKPGGRFGIASMSREKGESVMLRLYEWAHTRWPRYIDCRPIYVERSLRDAGYEISATKTVGLFGLPEEIVVGVKPA
jgi:demethylmenaquinone methyltransferase/2-methoxy-6-polyprenyl-1,4-benzoquinol methylase